MHYLVYKITNNITGKIYIGAHKTENINDGYGGSGTVLKRAYKKYGRENFKKEILSVFDNPEDMWDTEALLVNEEFVADKDTYNICTGGQRGSLDIRNTEYHQSGRHKANYIKAAKMGNEVQAEKRLKRIGTYNLNPTVCLHCDAPFEYDKRKNRFCNSSCAASHNNTGRVVSDAHREKVSKSLSKPDGVHQRRLKGQHDRKVEKEMLKERQKKEVLSSGIDFSKPGWTIKVAKLLGFPARVMGSEWMRANLPDLHEEICFKRT